MSEKLQKTIPIGAFETLGTPSERALKYPFSRPDGSYFSDGEEITMLPSDFEGFTQQANDKLSSLGLPLIEDRIPVLAYGANCNPVSFKEKMSKFGTEQPEVMQPIPALEVSIPDVKIVWHGRPGIKTTFADMYFDGKGGGSASKGMLQYMTVEQFMNMSTTEGGTYELRTVRVITADGLEKESLAYVPSQTTILMGPDNEPVRVAGTAVEEDGHPSDETVMTNEEAIGYMLEGMQETSLTEDPFKFTRNNMPGGLPLKQRQEIRRQIGAALQENGRSANYSFPRDEGTRVLRGVVNFVPENPAIQTMESKDSRELPFVQMPEQVLAHRRPSEQSIQAEVDRLVAKGKTPEEARRSALLGSDIVYKLRTQIHDELARRLESDDKSGSS